MFTFITLPATNIRIYLLQNRNSVKLKFSPDIKYCFGEKAEQRVIESIGLHAAALHHCVDHSAHQNTVDGIGRRGEQVTV